MFTCSLGSHFIDNSLIVACRYLNKQYVKTKRNLDPDLQHNNFQQFLSKNDIKEVGCVRFYNKLCNAVDSRWLWIYGKID